MKGGQTYDKEKIQVNLARLKTHGHTFEVAIEPDAALKYRKGGIDDVREVVKSEDVFHDAKKGEHASERLMKKVFDTSDSLEIIDRIITEGEIQLTSEIRDRKREQKKKQVMDMIHKYSVNPRDDTPHPRSRIENAFKEANVKVDENRAAEDQIKEILDELKPIIPIKLEIKQVQIHLSSQYAAKMYGTVKQFGSIVEEDWQDDGSWLGVVEIPGGLETELYDKLNSATHGEVETKVIKTK